MLPRVVKISCYRLMNKHYFLSYFYRERIIVPLDQHIVVCPRGAGVDEGAGVDKVDIFYTGLFYTGTLGVDDEVPVYKRVPAGVEDERRKNVFYTGGDKKIKIM